MYDNMDQGISNHATHALVIHSSFDDHVMPKQRTFILKYHMTFKNDQS